MLGPSLSESPWLSGHGRPTDVCRYVQHYDLSEASDDVASVLKQVAVRLRKTRKVKVLTGTGELVGREGTLGTHSSLWKAYLRPWAQPPLLSISPPPPVS